MSAQPGPMSIVPPMPYSRHQSMSGLSMWGPGMPLSDSPPVRLNPVPLSNPLEVNVGYPPLPRIHSPPAPYNTYAPYNTDFAARPTSQRPPIANRSSTYSMATIAARPKAPVPPPSQSASPSDGEIVTMTRKYLASQDLMVLCVDYSARKKC